MRLEELDPFDLFDAEARRLDSYFDSLDEAAWQRPSRCAGWSVRDVLAHLAGEEAYNHACLDGTTAQLFAMLEAEGASGLDGFNEWSVQQRRGRPVAEVLAEWRRANEVTRSRMRELGRDAILQTAAGPYPAGLQTFHYASEFATHADDIGVPVTPEEEPGRTDWRVRVGQFALTEQGSPAEVTPAHDGLAVRVNGAGVRLSRADFVEATVSRLPDEHPLDPRLRQVLACLA
jgi:uncharacterized protein (TIGR03083 family)